MHFTSPCIFLALTIFNGLLAGAAPLNPKAGLITLPIRAINRNYDKNRPINFTQMVNRAYVRAGKLSGRPVKRALQEAKEPTAPNSIPLDIDGLDVSYIATIQAGTPPRDFKILMDSGSADFWIGSEICREQNGGDCGIHNFIGPKSSSTFENTTQPWNITYGSGFAAGFMVRDNLVIAGKSLENHTFGIAEVESDDFTTSDFDGLMGLAQSGLSNQEVPTPIEALAIEGHIKEAIVSYKISRSEDNLHDGEITLGGLDSSKFDAKTLTTVPNVSPIGFWEADMDDVSMNGKSLNFGSRTAILDTGTTLVFGPKRDVQALYDTIEGSKFDGKTFFLPCNHTDKVALTFGGRAFTIDPRDLGFVQVNPNGDCMGGIQTGAVDDNGNGWLVGDVFLKNAYFSTDTNRNTVSLAELV